MCAWAHEHKHSRSLACSLLHNNSTNTMQIQRVMRRRMVMIKNFEMNFIWLIGPCSEASCVEKQEDDEEWKRVERKTAITRNQLASHRLFSHFLNWFFDINFEITTSLCLTTNYYFQFTNPEEKQIFNCCRWSHFQFQREKKSHVNSQRFFESKSHSLLYIDSWFCCCSLQIQFK